MFDNDIINHKSRRRYINDIYLLAAVFLFAGILYLMIRTLMPSGTYICIDCGVADEGSEYSNALYSLDDEGYIVIFGSGDIDKILQDIDGNNISPLIKDVDGVCEYLDGYMSCYTADNNDQVSGIDKSRFYSELNKDGYVDLKGIYAEDTDINIIKIYDHKADMIASTCPDLICVHSKPISRSSESIVCLPHKVVITVVNKKDNETLSKEQGSDTTNDTDAITW